MEKLSKIQKELKAPKNQRNNFGNYNYRSCEDILEAVKPLLDGAILTITDDIVEVGGRVYVKATARFKDGDFEISNTAFAREEEAKKGMDASQITGSTSSYARKYALNGLFLIDDVKDADAQDNKTDFEKDASKLQAQQTRETNKQIKADKNSPEGLKERYESCKKFLEKLPMFTDCGSSAYKQSRQLVEDLTNGGMIPQSVELEDMINQRMPKIDDSIPTFED